MGYTTKFKGRLEFTQELTASQIAHLGTLLGEDRREHPEWKASDEFYYVDLEVTKDFAALQWSGAEKTYGMVAIVNTVIRVMREKWPDFGLRGRFDAQGDEIGDVWALVVDGGEARKIEMELRGRKVTCPHCEETFVLDGEVVQVG